MLTMATKIWGSKAIPFQNGAKKQIGSLDTLEQESEEE